MATPGNSPTTDAAVLRAMVNKINDATSIPDQTAYVVAEPIFMGVAYTGDQYVQVVPGAAVDRIGTGNTRGLIETEVRAVVYKRLFLDSADIQTELITNASIGLLQLVGDVDGQLINSMLDGLIVQPIVPVRRAPVVKPPVFNSGWSSVERFYTLKYVVSYPAIQDQT